MINTINDYFKHDLNILYGIKEVFKSEQYVSLIKTKLNYTDDFKKILYDETDNCLEVYEKFIKPTIGDYINDKITKDEIYEMSGWNFNSSNTQKKEYFNKIFPQLVNLLIANVDKLDSDKEKYNEVIVAKPIPVFLPSESNINNKNDELLKRILTFYKNLRRNQIAGLDKTIKQNYVTGCHNHIMGSGKTIMELIHIDSHCNFVLDNKNMNGSIYMFVSSRINILKDIFFNNEKKEEYKKYNVDLDKYAIIDLVYDNIKNNSISKTKPNIIVANIQYLKIIQDDEEYFNKIIKNLKLVVFDECHNISAPSVFNFMKEIQKKLIPILGFSATPMRTTKDAKANFKSIFSIDNKVNMISTYDLFEAIIDDYILPFKIKQYEFKGIYNENVDDNSSEKVKYSKHDFEKNKLIVKNILQDEMKEAPYCKIVAWCSSISNLMKWKKFIEEEIPELKVYIAHSGNADNPAVNEYGDFYALKPKNKDDKTKINALLLNVSIVSEGCDIDFVDSGIFLDPVKNKNIVTYLQNAGRICRTDIYGRKTHANIIYTYLSEKKDITGQIISYFEMLLQLTEKNNDYFNKMNELVKNLKVDNKEIRIVIDKKEEHDCVMYLDKEVKDWNKIKKEVEKVVREKYGLGNENKKWMDLIGKYEYTHSRALKCILNNKVLKNLDFVTILKEVYKTIGDLDIIQKTNPKVKKGRMENEYISDLDVSFHRNGTVKNVSEIFDHCFNNKFKIEIDIKLKSEKVLKINFIDGVLNIEER
jgi:superfamily II DNA or RNA helicase